MKRFFVISLALITSLLLATNVSAQKLRTDANIVGHVVCCDEHIPFASISVKGTTIGTTTDETGHYQLINMPEGTHTIVAQCIGYTTVEKEVTISAGETKEIHFELAEDALNIDAVVVTADRNAVNRTDASVIVNTITPKIFATTQSVTLSEGLNFSPGLRMENNCQNCGFSQVRMNGMEGPYSQILINGRPIFSTLAGVYGLELIPSNMIERVEVIRGGGSALYGSNAIAGTINLILKDPVNNSYEVGANTSMIGLGLDDSGSPAEEYSLNFNTSLVSSDSRTGMAVYGFNRNRHPFDANGDSYSEISSLKNTTVGTRVFHRFSSRNKISADFFNIREDRRGGDQFGSIEHEAFIAEAVKHNITSGALTYEQFFRDEDLFSVFVSGQKLDRDSYYGANQSLADYGQTEGLTYVAGAQYNAKFDHSSLIGGFEHKGGSLKDKKMGYLDVDNAYFNGTEVVIPRESNRMIADQQSNITGVFAQYDISFNQFKVSVGGRYDHYEITDEKDSNADKSGDVFSPRVTLKYDILPSLQARASYAQGYRAPQIFDEDLHIGTSGAKQIRHQNDPDLKQETSHSYMASLDFHKKVGTVFIGFLAEGFYTQLDDAFANEFPEKPDENGVTTYTRINAENGASVKGANFELNLVPSSTLNLKAGFTVQKSEYEDPIEFDETEYFRTPNEYGYFTIDWDPVKNLCVAATGNYTGSMLVPYGEAYLNESDPFFDLGMKVGYSLRLNGAKMQVFAGMKNIFNAYQDDFDRGVTREPGYVYGPMMPRTIYFGVKIGNFIK